MICQTLFPTISHPETPLPKSNMSQDHPLRSIIPPTLLPEPILHPDHQEISREVITYLVDTWDWPSARTKKAFISWNLPEVVLFMFPTGVKSRVKLACEFLLLGFLMDGSVFPHYTQKRKKKKEKGKKLTMFIDHFDNQTLLQNSSTVSRLQLLLSSPSTFTPSNKIESMHSSIFTQFLSLDSSLPILQTYISMLQCHCLSDRGTNISSFRTYLSFREIDVGMPICSELMYWTEPDLLKLTTTQREKLRPLERIANYHVSILNDVFSFDREWKAAREQGEGAVMVNGVMVLSEELGVGVGVGRGVCVGIVRGWETEFLGLVEEMGLEGELMKRAVKGIERRMAGAEGYSWRTRRYL
ncbi:putative terpene cyclase [Podospora fimiseda]|uniref:Terpene synthase n=1 Tax=Podospora fimiseda TaxID=252190 RepID=A0AAN7BG63_9PEZI|nr:putative terpene cyclase [Podospora fimiseda]